jgi:hypothetical protein
MLAVADRLEDLPVAEVDVTSTADLTRLLEPSAPASPVRTFRYARTKRAALTVAGSEHLRLPEVFPSWRARCVHGLVRAVDASGSGGHQSRHRSCGRPTGSVAAAGLPPALVTGGAGVDQEPRGRFAHRDVLGRVDGSRSPASRQASRPFHNVMAATTSATAGSAHHQPRVKLRPSPANTVTDRALDIQVSVDCATSTGLSRACPVRRCTTATGTMTIRATTLSKGLAGLVLGDEIPDGLEGDVAGQREECETDQPQCELLPGLGAAAELPDHYAGGEHLDC